MTDTNVVSLKAITPPRWEGEVTDYMLEMIVKGLLVPNVETSRRLAYELMEARKTANSEQDDYGVKFMDAYLSQVQTGGKP